MLSVNLNSQSSSFKVNPPIRALDHLSNGRKEVKSYCESWFIARSSNVISTKFGRNFKLCCHFTCDISWLEGSWTTSYILRSPSSSMAWTTLRFEKTNQKLSKILVLENKKTRKKFLFRPWSSWGRLLSSIEPKSFWICCDVGQVLSVAAWALLLLKKNTFYYYYN